jgi:curved DNA-binding protein CbpA
MDPMNNHYLVLGVPHTESTDGIHKAYRRLAKECHPDHAGGQGAEKFHAIQEAYEVLSDVGRRKEYDEQLRAGRRVLRQEAEPLIRPRSSRPRAEPLAAQGNWTGPHIDGQDNGQDILLALIRHEIYEFGRLSECLLSPIRLSPALTDDEEAFVRLYLEQLMEKYGL